MSTDHYKQLQRELDESMARAGGLTNESARQDWVTRAFVRIYVAYCAEQFPHADYVRLVNRLARYAGGAFNDYLDLLTGAAWMGMLDILLRQLEQPLAEQARQRSQAVTQMTGIPPVPFDEKEEKEQHDGAE